MTDEEFCERLLLEEKVAVVPGSAFGESGRGFIRASTPPAMQHRNRAQRMGRFVECHGLASPSRVHLTA
jgi:aminotransferase